MPRVCKKRSLTDEQYDIIQMESGLSRLYIAAKEEDFFTVRKILLSGVDINQPESSDKGTPVFGAILSGNKQMVQEFISAGADVNAQVPSELGAGGTPLIMAIHTQKAEIVQLLLDSGADVHKRIFKKNTVLHFCAEMGTTEIAELLINRGVGVDVRNNDDETPLHIAVRAGNTQMTRLLISKGADFAAMCTEKINENGVVKKWSNVTPLFLAAHRGHADIVDLLIEKGVDVNVKTSANCTALLMAAQCGHVKVVNTLLEAGAKSSVNVRSNHILGYTPLALAVTSGDVDVIKALLKVEGVEVNPKRAAITPLIVAAGKGYLDVVKLLLANGALISGCTVTGMTPLHMALMVNRDDSAEYLIEHGADIHAKDCSNTTPLHVACDKNVSMNIIQMLVEKGSNVNMKKDDGVTPLHLAAQHDRVELIKLLIDHGAYPNAVTEDKWTALHYAAVNGNKEVIAYLTTDLSDIDAVTCSSTTPLHLAVEKGHREVVEILLKLGANVGAEDDTKRTPLHIALKKGHLEIAERLIKQNAPVNVKEKKKGRTPLFLAVENESGKLVNLLLDKGANANSASKVGVLPIHVAAKAENVEIVKALLVKGAYYDKEVQEYDYFGVPLDFAQEAGNAELITILESVEELFSAVEKNNVDQVERCIQAGAIVNGRKANGRMALHYAVSNCNSAAVKALLKGGADITLAVSKIDSPLHTAVAINNMDIAEILLTHAKTLNSVKYNFVVNAEATEGGGTMLHTAVVNNNPAIVKILLRNGTVYNIKNDSGKTPLDLSTADEAVKSLLISAKNLFEAVKRDDVEKVTRILGNDNSAVNAREADDGATPLYRAISKGGADVARALLSNGADYCLVTNDGSTSLHIAASAGNVKIIQMLLNFARENNVEKVNDFINATTVYGTTALHFASNLEVAKCLLQAGAMYNICSEDKTMLELIQNDDVRKFVKTVHRVFENVEKSASTVMDVLNGLDVEDFKAVTSTRNTKGETLVQVALMNGRRQIACQLVKRLKELS